MSPLKPFALVLAVAAAILVGHEVRSGMAVDLTVESVRAYVHGLGILAPVLFVGIVIFRNFLLLPSLVVLTAGGLVFGALAGTVLGGLGIFLSGAMKFGIARGIGRGLVRDFRGERMRSFDARVAAAGPLVIGLSTAHPMGPMSPLHWGAGVSKIAWFPFLLALALAGPVRAGAYSWFGASLVEPGSSGFYLATAALLAVSLLPLAHPAVRNRVLGRSDA